MTTRKQMQKQRRLERERQEQASSRDRAVRYGLLIGIAAAGIAVVAVAVVSLAPIGGSSATSGPVQSVVLTMRDNNFEPSVLTIKAGQSYEIGLWNQGQNPHNVWLVGPNRKDYRSDDYAGGESGSMKLKIDEPGEYGFVCTFHAGMGGQLVVE
jgi:plastocyanin